MAIIGPRIRSWHAPDALNTVENRDRSLTITEIAGEPKTAPVSACRLTHPTGDHTLGVRYDEEFLEEMIPVEAWTTIRYLYAQGKSIRATAKELDLARNTVRSALREEGQPHYSRPPRANPKLEPFLERIDEVFCERDLIG